ncbi:unnamed protein product, partial [marine sediment metagenome]
MAQKQFFENENLKNSTFNPKTDLFYEDAQSVLWDLPGHGDPYDSCGDFYSKGCLNSREHQDKLIFIKRMVSTCLRAECPICYQKWAGKQAHAIAYRLEQAKAGRLFYAKVIHVDISLPEKEYFMVEKDYNKLRRKM